ncbi:protein methyltransferase [Candidatus Photodesmus katoptron]|uniref:Release factor glutamine methyltransferase n=1 Tax=Candidatus Photodesmus katoptron Akat1 TaxID=1236703 RepID=S3DLB8_9GAMM|nr:peptide chain release factor N(5)-glutamine methyltransferase [Candidatus Photodesmus katoptron]EPE37949.1 protein methyltransferase, release factor-specific [Candidatus Photodesmus katoptron Akat1]KEY90264.1 protein methyltransferase [Candidatus Photodesmus katoptron]
MKTKIISFPNIELTLKFAVNQLRKSGSSSPYLDASILLSYVLVKSRSYLFTWPNRLLKPSQFYLFNQLLSRRLSGEPIAYIVGEREFWSLPFKVSSSTLIPRPDTELLIEIALDKTYNQKGFILDLGTGVGIIALVLAFEMPKRDIFGIDINPEAKLLAVENASRLGITNVKFFVGNWFEAINNDIKFSLIVSNPPYLKKDDLYSAQGDIRFEPVSALVANDEGLSDIKYIAKNSLVHLEHLGWLILEHAYDQGKAVRDILLSLGYQKVLTKKDYAQNDRVTFGQFSKK